MMSLTQSLFSFQGRMNRKPWWLTSVAIFFIMMILIFAIFAVLVVAEADHKGALGTGGPKDFVIVLLYLMLGAVNLVSHNPMALMAAPDLLFGAVLVLSATILSLWIGLALGAKRLHDRNKSAWWLVVFWLLPPVLQPIGERIEGTGLIFILAALAIWIWGLVEIGFLRGAVGPNQYGPNPLEGRGLNSGA
jgi:uncharacterized membrane protein YhaH (DUF805 family)